MDAGNGAAMGSNGATRGEMHPHNGASATTTPTRGSHTQIHGGRSSRSISFTVSIDDKITEAKLD